jgi:hypothetical protein
LKRLELKRETDADHWDVPLGIEMKERDPNSMVEGTAGIGRGGKSSFLKQSDDPVSQGGISLTRVADLIQIFGKSAEVMLDRVGLCPQNLNPVPGDRMSRQANDCFWMREGSRESGEGLLGRVIAVSEHGGTMADKE